ncbi:MAG: aKG-HExxH-type peptide beta-hydroxylase [Asticcacaulis sp.]
MAVLRLIADLPDSHLAAFLLHPAVRYWLQAVRRTGHPDLADHRPLVHESLPSLVWALASLSQCNITEWRVRADALGGLRVIPFGVYIELGAERAGQNLSIRLDAEQFRLCDLSGEDLAFFQWTHTDVGYPVPVCLRGSAAVRVFETIFSGQVVIEARDPFLRVHLTGTNQRRDGTEFFTVETGPLYDESRSVPHIHVAAEKLESVWPEAAEDIGLFSPVLVPIWLPHTQRGAFTVSSRQGAIFIGEGDEAEVIEMLLHENAHVKLRQIQLLDTLLEDPLDDSLRVSVPWRPDPRPIPGVLEGLFVFSHVAEFHRRYDAAGVLSRSRVESLSRDLRAAHDLVRQSARLTAEGKLFLDDLGEWIEHFTVLV